MSVASPADSYFGPTDRAVSVFGSSGCFFFSWKKLTSAVNTRGIKKLRDLDFLRPARTATLDRRSSR
jgi:hypothetical protein